MALAHIPEMTGLGYGDAGLTPRDDSVVREVASRRSDEAVADGDGGGFGAVGDA